jgi:hypothetical protein
MKKLLYFIAIFTIIIACNNQDENKEGSTYKDSIPQLKDTASILQKPHHKNKKEEISNKDSTFYYEPAVSILSGKLMEDEFYGAPGFGATPDKDSREKQFILHLDNPINVKPGKGSDEALETKTKVDEITLIIDKKTSKFKHDIGKAVKVKGKLFPAETGHHHTPVLMGDAEIVK